MGREVKKKSKEKLTYFNGSLNSSSVGSKTGHSGGGVNLNPSTAFISIALRKLGVVTRTAIFHFHIDMYTDFFEKRNMNFIKTLLN